MSEPDLLLALGIKTQDVLAGLAGGVVNSFVFKQSNPMAITGSIVVGALTANYLGDVASKYTGTSGGASAFIVGLVGMAVCQGIAEAATRWKPGAKTDVV